MTAQTLARPEIVSQPGKAGRERFFRRRTGYYLHHPSYFAKWPVAANNCLILLAAMIGISILTLQPERAYTANGKPTPEDVVARHLNSIGKAEILAAVQSRMVQGIVSVRRPLGVVPQVLPEPGERLEPSNFQLASAGKRLGIAMRFYDPVYPAEHFAFDGESAAVSLISYGKRSLLGEYVDRYSGLMREGLLGGTLSTAWPFLNIREGGFKLKYDETEHEGAKYHQITYIPKSRRYLDRIVAQVYLDFTTYRHVVTEYRLMDPGGAAGSVLVLEKFQNYKDVDGLMLPFSYSIECPAYDPYHSYWIVEIQRVSHSVPPDAQIFKAR